MLSSGPLRNRGRGVVLSCSIAMSTSCEERPGSEDPPVSERSTQGARFLFDGCWAASEGPVCHARLGDEIVLWTSIETEAPKILMDGERVPTQWEAAAPGRRTRLSLDHVEDQVVVALEDQVVWRLSVERESDLDSVERFNQAMEAARTANKSGNWRGSVQLRGEAARIAIGKGWSSLAARQWAAAGYTLLSQGGGLEGIDAILSSAAASAPASTLDPAHVENAKAFLDLETGDLRSATTRLESVIADAERLDNQLLVYSARQLRSQIFADLGLWTEALGEMERIERLAALPKAPCFEANLANHRGWIMLLARESGVGSGDPSSHFEEAIELTRDACTGSLRAHAKVNLARSLLLTGEVASAEAALEAVRVASRQFPAVELDALELSARLAEKSKSTKSALGAYGALAELALSLSASDHLRRARLAMARLLSKLGKRQQAIALFKTVIAQIRDQSISIALGSGRSSFLALGNEATDALIRVLIATGQYRQAVIQARALRRFTFAHLADGLRRDARFGDPALIRSWRRLRYAYRRARTRHRRALEELWMLDSASPKIQRLRLKADELEAEVERTLARLGSLGSEFKGVEPDRSTLSVGVHGLGEEWLVYGLRRGQLAFFETRPAGDSAALDSLGPFLENVRLVRLMVDPRLEPIDFHGFEVRGTPLALAVPVSHALDVRRSGPGRVGAVKTALVWADSMGDLPSARDEGRLVAHRLKESGYSIEKSIGIPAAGLSFREAVIRSDYLHFSGHAEYGGRDGWGSALMVAPKDRFSIPDALALPRSPRRIVLTGCEAARSEDEIGLGIAQAFVLAGSQFVAAPSRRVGDELALAYAQRFLSERGPMLLNHHKSIRDLAKQVPGSDWRALRILTP